MIGAMALLPEIELSNSDKLETLRRLDQFRKWGSLDDKRYCLCCGNLLTGWEIQVVGGTRGTGPLRVICPTDLCNSIPMDWALPTDEVLSTISMRRNAALATIPKFRVKRGESAMRIRLRWLADQFKRTA
jgi:hypothetical protein